MAPLLESDRRAPLRSLLTLMAEGERLAADCARAQSRLAGEAGLAGFFRAQARQESLHALIFDNGLRWLGGPDAPLRGLTAYRARLAAALDAGKLTATVVGTQVVLEALGHAVLEELDAAMEQRGCGMHRLRRIVLRQESAHRAFGRRYLERSATRLDEGLRSARPFLALAGALIDEAAPMLAGLAVDAGHIRLAFLRNLPDTLRECR